MIGRATLDAVYALLRSDRPERLTLRNCSTADILLRALARFLMVNRSEIFLPAEKSRREKLEGFKTGANRGEGAGVRTPPLR